MKLRAKHFPKLHHPDPSGFWNLVRTGERLPAVGEHILFVYDIRGTPEELRWNLLVNVAKGDPYRITNEAISSIQGPVGDLMAETLRLPTKPRAPSVHYGVVNELGFNEVLQEHWISVKNHSSVWGSHFSADCIVYWAPMPAAPDTFTPTPVEYPDLFSIAWAEQMSMDKWEARKRKKNEA